QMQRLLLRDHPEHAADDDPAGTDAELLAELASQAPAGLGVEPKAFVLDAVAAEHDPVVGEARPVQPLAVVRADGDGGAAAEDRTEKRVLEQPAAARLLVQQRLLLAQHHAATHQAGP